MPDCVEELAAAILQLKSHYPHWRLGQLVCNLAFWAGEDKPGEVWHVTDEELLVAAKTHLARLHNASDDSRGAAS